MVPVAATARRRLAASSRSKTGRQGDKETRRIEETHTRKRTWLVAQSPCLPLSLSPCLFHRHCNLKQHLHLRFEKSFARHPALTVTISTAMHRDDRRSIDWPAELDRHGRWLRTVALARVGEAAAADDVLQEVSLTAIQKGHQLRDPTRIAGWLYRLVVVAALQYRRRQGRRKKLLDRYADRQPSAEARPASPTRSVGYWSTNKTRWSGKRSQCCRRATRKSCC